MRITVSTNKIKLKKAISQQNRLGETDLSESIDLTGDEFRKYEYFGNTILHSGTHPFLIINTNDYTITTPFQISEMDDLRPGITCHKFLYGIDKPCDNADYICPIGEIKKTKKDIVAEHIRRDIDGNTINIMIHAYPVLDDSCDIVEIRMYSLDITEFRQIRKSLEEKNDYLRMAIRAARIGTFNWDIVENRSEWSKELLNIFGTTAEQFGGCYEAYLEFVPPENQQAIDKIVREFLKNARHSNVIQYDHEIIRPNGKRAWIEVRGRLFINDQGQPLRILGICIDISDRKLADEQLKQKHTELIEEQVKLRKKNLALKEIFNQIETEKNIVKSRIQSNINRFILPILNDLENSAHENQKVPIKILRQSLIKIASPFINQLESTYSNLSPRETEICKLIKEEYTSKEIASLLGLSVQTIHLRRKHIRKKLQITNKDVNLPSYLKSI